VTLCAALEGVIVNRKRERDKARERKRKRKRERHILLVIRK